MRQDWIKPRVSQYSTARETLKRIHCDWCNNNFNTQEEYNAHLTKVAYTLDGKAVTECPKAPDYPPDTQEVNSHLIS